MRHRRRDYFPAFPYKLPGKLSSHLHKQYGIHVIMLITPETSEERIRQIDAHTDGSSMVSSAAVTGAQRIQCTETNSLANVSNKWCCRNPRMIGFGISNKSTYESAAACASGCIIGEQIHDLARGGKRCQKGHRQTVGNAKKRRIINHSVILAAYSFQSKHIFALCAKLTKHQMIKPDYPSVLLIYTGGTIGMIENPGTGALEAFN